MMVLSLRPPSDAAAVLVNELRERVAVLDLVDAGLGDVARDRDQLRAGALGGADLAERLGAVADDAGDVGQRLDVVDDRRLLVEAADGEPGRAVARVSALALDRRDEARRLAADVGPGAAVDDDVAGEVAAEDALAGEARGVGLVERALDAAERQVELAADVDERVADLQRVRGDQHRLEQQVRRMLEDPAVLERAGLALVGVGAEVMGLPVVELDHRPLAADGECRPAVAEQPRGRHFRGDLLRRHARQRLRERRVAAARAVLRQQVRRRGDGEAHQQLPARHVSRAP